LLKINFLFVLHKGSYIGFDMDKYVEQILHQFKIYCFRGIVVALIRPNVPSIRMNPDSLMPSTSDLRPGEVLATTSQLFDVTAKWSMASASNTISCHSAIVSVLN
jgi:hypothetical protein